ncbi:hypothetical protein [Streptomyces bottropensis]|uniref:hypothetical protein n=1 Tax=Streptomyces bottropensis TaxID=42235 RepID=UPI0036C416DB
MTRTRQATTKKTPAKRPPRKALAKPAALTLVDLRKPLHVRRRNFVGPYTPAQITEARAALASAMARLPIPSLLWLTQADGRAYAKLPNGTLLIHTHPTAPEFDAHIPCRHGAHHQHLVTSARDLAEARTATHACEDPHATPTADEGACLDWDNAINHGVTLTRPAKTGVVLKFREGTRRAAHTLHDDTEPLTLTDITAGLAERANATADAEQPKEHPQP